MFVMPDTSRRRRASGGGRARRPLFTMYLGCSNPFRSARMRSASWKGVEGCSRVIGQPNNELQRTSDGNAAGSPLNSVFCGQQ